MRRKNENIRLRFSAGSEKNRTGARQEIRDTRPCKKQYRGSWFRLSCTIPTGPTIHHVCRSKTQAPMRIRKRRNRQRRQSKSEIKAEREEEIQTGDVVGVTSQAQKTNSKRDISFLVTHIPPPSPPHPKSNTKRATLSSIPILQSSPTVAAVIVPAVATFLSADLDATASSLWRRSN